MPTDPAQPPPPPPRPELPYQPPPGAASPPKTSGFAIASFVLGLIGGVVLSVIFGIVALRRIRNRGLRGRGLAIAGLVLSGCWTLLLAAGLTLSLLNDAERDDGGRITEAGAVSVFDLEAGDCLIDLEENSETRSADATPCARAHDAEVLGSFQLAGGRWPGEDSVFALADERCNELLAEATSDARVSPFYFHPTEASWAQGDREVVCVAEFERPRRGEL